MCFVFIQTELSNQQKVCTEITKALEETRRQKEELQARVSKKTFFISIVL